MFKQMSTAAAMLAAGFLVNGATAAELRVLWQADGFDLPESVSYHAGTDAFFVSNIGTDPMAKDGDGFVSRLRRDGSVESLRWVTDLNAPKGTEISGDTLYVTDIDELVAIDIPTATIRHRIPIAGAAFLNDLAVADDGRVFMSDTFGGAIFVAENGTSSEWLRDANLVGPNGLVIEDNHLVVAELGDISGGFENLKPGTVKKIDLATKEVTPYGTADAIGGLDGIEKAPGGGVLVTDNPSGRVLKVLRGQPAVEVAALRPGAADFERAAVSGGPILIVVPIIGENAVVAYEAPE